MTIREHVENLPDAPGVYFFLGPKQEILYIGKATSLRDRVRSYFASDLISTRGALLVKMLSEAETIDFRETPSPLEALILESSLIKTHKPPYNTKAKDDKSYYSIIITDEDFPRVLLAREKDILGGEYKGIAIKHTFGPFPQASLIKSAMKIIRKIFPFRDTCVPYDPESGKIPKPCFNAQIGLCPGVCTGAVSKKEYRKSIESLAHFLGGDTKRARNVLVEEMGEYAKQEQFEKAEKIKRRIESLDHVRDMTLMKRDFDMSPRENSFRIESYDIAHLSGKEMVGVMVVFEETVPVPAEYRKFKIESLDDADDTAALREIVTRRFGHPEWQEPNLIVVDGGVAQKRAVESTLDSLGKNIPLVSVVKDDTHKP